MTENKPFWKNDILYVWSDYYNSYIANYVPPIHQILCTGRSISEWKEMMGLDKYEVMMGMTEKRFISKDESIINVATDELVNASSDESAKILVDWLNELSDKYVEQRKENYGLLDGIAFYKEENASLSERMSDLECENEQLKSEKEHYKKQVDELDGLLNKYEITFEELEEILDNDYRERF